MSIAQNEKIGRITEKTLIIGVDIAKKDHVARASNFRGMEVGKPITFSNDLKALHKLWRWATDLLGQTSLETMIVGLEPTGHDWMNLAQYCRERGVTVVLVNPLHVKRSKGLEDNHPTKNDRKDARVISQLVKDGRYSIPHLPEGVFAELRVGMNQ